MTIMIMIMVDLVEGLLLLLRVFWEIEGREISGRRRRVDEVGASFKAAHGTGGAVVSTGGLLRRVEGAKPAPLLRLRVSYLSRITAPRPTPDATVPHGAAGGTRGAASVVVVVSHRPLVGGGGTLLGVVGDYVGVLRVGFGNRSHSVETPQSFLHMGRKKLIRMQMMNEKKERSVENRNRNNE